MYRAKGSTRPILPLKNRLESIDLAEEVDYCFPVRSSTLAIGGLFMRLRPDIYIEDIERANGKTKRLFLQALGIRYALDDRSERPPELEKISSSLIIATLGANEAKRASSLGYGHHLSSEGA